MECNTEKSINLVKEFDKSWVIPKKKTPETLENANNPSNTDQQSVVNNAYPAGYDYGQYYKPDICIYQEYWANEQQTYMCNSNQQEERHQNQDVKRTASYNNEKPKNQDLKAKYKDRFVDLYDSSLPEELRKLLQPLYCQLCCASLNSNLNARMHYASKNHNKKMKQWLTEHSLQSGEPLHKRALLGEITKQTTETEAKYFHCAVCDLPLTGRVHAEQHYCGKNHQKALIGKRAPSGKGYYNDQGKWIRTVVAKSDLIGRDGFGQGFILAPPAASANVVPNFDATASICAQLYCDVCHISVTSFGQMKVHRVGHKHQKKLKVLQTPGTAAVPTNGAVQATNSSAQYPDGLVAVVGDVASYYAASTATAATPENGVLTEDYLARFRTPSGQYYCKTCDMSVNSETQFGTHVQSKKHTRKVNLSKT